MSSSTTQIMEQSPLDNGAASDYYWNSYSHFGIHEEMIKDSIRTGSYRKAIMAENLLKGKVVLDVGCGTGILSLFAAQAGAKKVYGIECADIVDQAKIIVEKNGYANVVTLIKGKVEEVEIPEKVDVIISEWMGYFLMYESMLSSVIFAREKWLKPDGIILPDRCSLHIEAIEDADYRSQKVDWWWNVYGFDMSNIGVIARSEPLVDVVEAKQVCTNSCKMIEFDMYKVTQKDIGSWHAPFELIMGRDDYVHAFSFYFNVAFTHSKVFFSTSPHTKYTHWKQAVIYIEKTLCLNKGEKITGDLVCSLGKKNARELDLVFGYQAQGKDCNEAEKANYFMR